MWKTALLCGLLAASTLFADISGIWTGQQPDRNGDLQNFAFQFVQKGDSITGKMYGDNESTPITEGKLSGEQVRFTVTGELNGQINKAVYSGTVKGDEMEIFRERKLQPGKQPPAEKQPAPKPIQLKRLVNVTSGKIADHQ